MKKPILMILMILFNFGYVINAATTDFTRIDPAYFKLENITTSATENHPKEDNFVDIKLRVNRCVETIIITTNCSDYQEQQISTFSGTRSEDCE